MPNFKNNAWLYLFTGLLLTANIVTLAMLWMHKGGHDEHQPGGGPRPQLFEYISNELKFDEKQKDAYRLLRDEHQKGVRQIQDSMRIEKDALFTMLQQNNVSEELIIQQSNKAAALSARMDVFTFHHFQKVRALCNPEQQKKFDDIIEEAVRSMGQQHQGPPPHGGPPHP